MADGGSPPDAGRARHPVALSAPRFVGRARQLAAVRRALAAPPAIVHVAGEAGIGKTRLVRECLQSTGLAPGRVLTAACPPHRGSATLAPVVDALRQAGVPPAARARLTGLAGALRPLFPEWTGWLPPAPEPVPDAAAARYRLFRALAELIEACGVAVLVLEDLHWADDTSLEFLLFLATRRHWHRDLSLVVTYRPEDVAAASLLRRLSASVPLGTTQLRVPVPALTVAESAELASSMLGGAAVSRDLVAFLHEWTDGVPLAVEETVRLLGDRADLVQHDGEWHRDPEQGVRVPPTVRESTRERVYRLPGAARAVLRAAAVLAEPADERTLAAVAGLAEPAAVTALVRAVASGLLSELPGGRFAFRHVLAALAVYEGVPPRQRRRLHRRAGRVLAAARPLPTATLARHYREAGDLIQWTRYAEQAADRAVESSDHLSAVDLLDDLLTRAGPVPVDRVRLATKLGLAVLFARDSGGRRAWRAVQTLRAVAGGRGLGRPARAEVRNVLGRVLNQLGEHAEAFSEMAAAVPDLEHRPVDAARTMICLGWPRVGRWPAATHLRWLRRAERLPLTGATRADRLTMQVDRATALLELGEPAGWQAVEALPAEVDTGEQRLQLARGLLNIGDAALLWGRYRQGREILHRALAMSDEGGFRRIGHCARVNLARLDWLTGAWDGLADRLAALGVGDTELAARHEITLLTGKLLAARGGHREAAERFGSVVQDVRARGAALTELDPAAALGALQLADGDVEAALRSTAGAAATVRDKRIWVWADGIAQARVAALARAGRAEEATAYVTGLATGLRGRDAPAPRAALATCRAILAQERGDHTAAARMFARARRAWEALPRPYDALLAEQRRAGCLLAAGRTSEAVAALSRVWDGFTDLGASGDADRVAQQLRGLRVTVPWRGGRRGYGDQLSPRELDVVRLVVVGRTNREIARQLHKSPQTVAEQLRSAMRKLGASSRTALAVRAVAAGVVPGERARAA